jgi:hypothetical protein
MRRLLPLVAILAVGCASAPGSAPSAAPASAPGGAAASQPAAATNAPSVAPASGEASTVPSTVPAAAALPAECAEGFTAYLKAIEPIVSKFDAASAKLGDVETLDEAVRSKSMELLTANNSRAPYSCPDVGLEWAYFDASSPWDAVLATANTAAPGTVAYLTARKGMSSIDVAKVADYGVSGCDAAVAKIQADVKSQSKKLDGARDMPLDDGLALLGLYKAYLHDVQNGVCPRDQLGNDEFDFFRGVG